MCEEELDRVLGLCYPVERESCTQRGGGYDEKCKYGEGRLGTVVSFDGSVVYIAVLYKVCL
jgi:hypothetical protein